MKLKEIIILVLALAFGFLGGLASARFQPGTFRYPTTITGDVVRAGRIELVDPMGRPRAILSLDARLRRDVTLSFLTPDGKTVASFGAAPNLPFLKLLGNDGIVRAELRLTGLDQPLLEFSDGTPNVRVGLGAFEGDDLTTARAETLWGLAFGDSSHAVAAMNMRRQGSDGAFAGGLSVINPKESLRVPSQ